MRAAMRLSVAGVLVGSVLMLGGIARAEQAGELVCPPSIGGMALYSAFLHDGDLGLRSTLDCEYGTKMSDGTAGDAAYLVIAWDATVDAGSEDGFTTMCTGAEDSIGQPSEISQWSEDLQVVDSNMVSRTKRAAASVRTWDYWDPPTKVNHQPFADVARGLLTVAEERALDCGATGTGTTGTETTGTETTGTETTGTGTGAAGGSNRRTAGTLLASGAGLTLLAGAGSVVVGRGSRRPVAGSGSGSTPSTEVLYSGPDAIRILRDAGLLQPVHGQDGSLIGYRPVGDLERFINQTPQWQPSFGKPVKTPGGAATHLGAVAFQEGSDGLIGDLTIAVREAAGSGPSAGGEPAPPGGGSAPPAPDVPGEPLAERLGRAWALAQVYGVPLEAALNAPSVIAGTPAPTSTSAPASAPASIDQVPAWLSTPGWKALKPTDIFRMFPQHFGAGGAIKLDPYSGSVPKITIGDGSFTAEVSSPIPFVPDVKVRGTLTPTPSGKGLLPTFDEVTVGDQPFGDKLEHQRKAAEMLNRFTQPVGDAGLRFGEVRMEDGEIKILVQREG